MFDTTYIVNTNQTQKKEWMVNSLISYVSSKAEKDDSFSAHFKQHFNNTTSGTYLRKYMTFKVLKKLNPIGTTKMFTKSNINLCTEERLTILEKLR